MSQPPAYQPYEVPAHPLPELVPAPIWRRAAARLIDLLVGVPITFLAIAPAVLVTLPLDTFLSRDVSAAVGAFLCFFLAYAAIEYFLLRRRSGQTLGKGLLGLRVVPAGPVRAGASAVEVPYAVKRDGRASALSGTSALLRMLVVIGPFLVAIALFLGTSTEGEDEWVVADIALYAWVGSLAVSTLMVLVDRRGRRSLHDLAAHTRVVRTERRRVAARDDLRMLLPGRVSLEKDSPTVTLTKPR